MPRIGIGSDPGGTTIVNVTNVTNVTTSSNYYTTSSNTY